MINIKSKEIKLKDLLPNPRNPRKITDQKLSMLEKSMDEHGSLDGIIYNRKTQRLLGGHQRQKLDPNAPVVITQSYDPPNEYGTVSEGYVVIRGQKYPFREVDWPEKKEMSANVAANKGGGEWNFPELSDWFLELDDGAFNLDFTMFDSEERQKIILPEVQVLDPGCDEDDAPEVPKGTDKTCKNCGFVVG